MAAETEVNFELLDLEGPDEPIIKLQPQKLLATKSCYICNGSTNQALALKQGFMPICPRCDSDIAKGPKIGS
jgi:hypothetical protein